MSSFPLGREAVLCAGAALMPAPKGWSTAKLRASTLKRLERLQEAFADDDTKPSVDGVINLLVDEHYSQV